MKLYEIDEAILDCFDTETGEILDEDRLNALQMEREKKIENVALEVKNLQAEVNALKDEEDALKKRRQSAERKIERYENWLAYILQGEGFKTVRCVITNRPSKQTVPDEDFVEWALKNDRDDLLTFGKPTANKTAIKAALLNGEEVPAEIRENYNISIK